MHYQCALSVSAGTLYAFSAYCVFCYFRRLQQSVDHYCCESINLKINFITFEYSLQKSIRPAILFRFSFKSKSILNYTCSIDYFLEKRMTTLISSFYFQVRYWRKKLKQSKYVYLKHDFEWQIKKFIWSKIWPLHNHLGLCVVCSYHPVVTNIE